MRISQSAMSMASTYASVRAEHERLEVRRTAPPPETPRPPKECRPEPDKDLTRDFNTYLLKLVVEWLSGAKIEEPEDLEPTPEGVEPQPPSVELHYERVRYEAERVHFHARGVVTTGDGRQIALDLRVGMQREHYERVTWTSARRRPRTRW